MAFAESIPIGHFDKDNKFFRNPPKNTLGYRKWLENVKRAKGGYWKSVGIYDIIQLSKESFKFNTGLVRASLYF